MPGDGWLSAARAAGLTRRDLERYATAELVDLAAELEGALEEAESRLRRIRRLQRQVDLPLEAIAIILRLQDRLAALEGAAARSRVTVRVIEERTGGA